METRKMQPSWSWTRFSLVLLATAAQALPTTRNQTVTDGACDCFLTNGSDPDYFTHHNFFDFRSLAQYANNSAPPLFKGVQNTTNAPATSSFFATQEWSSFWQVQNWNVSSAKLNRVNSLNNVYILHDNDTEDSTDTFLTLRTAREPQFQSAAEMVTVDGAFQFVSMRMRARTIGAPGACTAMFTYREGATEKDPVQEADLEVLTKYPKDHVQCTNQPATDSDGQIVEKATTNVTLPNGLAWDDWAEYRLDWTPRQSTWYIAGQQVANISFQTPRDASRIHINAWSDASAWTGAMAVNTEAQLQIQWWEILYNVSTTPANGRRAVDSNDANTTCNSVCSFDIGNATAGQAVLVTGESLAAGLLSTNMATWVSVTLMAMLALLM